MARFTIVPDDTGWDSYRRLVEDTHRRHNDWLMEISQKQQEIDVKLAVLTTKITIYAALASAAAAAAINIGIRMLPGA